MRRSGHHRQGFPPALVGLANGFDIAAVRSVGPHGAAPPVRGRTIRSPRTCARAAAGAGVGMREAGRRAFPRSVVARLRVADPGRAPWRSAATRAGARSRAGDGPPRGRADAHRALFRRDVLQRGDLLMFFLFFLSSHAGPQQPQSTSSAPGYARREQLRARRRGERASSHASRSMPPGIFRKAADFIFDINEAQSARSPACLEMEPLRSCCSARSVSMAQDGRQSRLHVVVPFTPGSSATDTWRARFREAVLQLGQPVADQREPAGRGGTIGSRFWWDLVHPMYTHPGGTPPRTPLRQQPTRTRRKHAARPHWVHAARLDAQVLRGDPRRREGNAQ